MKNGAYLDVTNNKQTWYKNSLLHRDDGPAVIYADGCQEWYQYGKLHREDGPAIINANGSQEWWQNDMPHREFGPAMISYNTNGSSCIEWWIHGIKISKEEFNIRLNLKTLL